MTSSQYQASALWRSAFGQSRKSRQEDEPARERLRASYLLTRETIATLLGELGASVPGFTVHDITHADALWETASLLCGGATVLTPAETYVLGCSFLFHDAAMGKAAYQQDVDAALGEVRWKDLLCAVFRDMHDQWPTPEELADPPADVVERCTVHAIRESHAKQAAILVDQSWKTSAGNELYLIQDLNLREHYGPLIGQLAESHWWDAEDLVEKFRPARGSLVWQPAEWIVEPLKLAFILRLADAIQIDGRRAPTFLQAIRQPRGVSREHWRFQEHVGRPHLVGNRLSYSSWRHFGRDDIDAWWLALDYLRGVDRELKKVDSLLYELGLPSLAVQAVAGVDRPQRFVEYFHADGWRPVDAVLTTADAPKIVGKLGGEQLYGQAQEVAVRELLQNAQDAVTARQAVDSSYTDGKVVVRLSKVNDSWFLEVEDNGLGMDEDVLLKGLLSFGTAGWSLDSVRHTVPGLGCSGFQPKGRFGIGFFAVFMLGDDIEVLTRRYDQGRDDARRLVFRGTERRPLLSTRGPLEGCPPGTTVRICLKTGPFDTNGIFSRTHDDNLVELVQRLAPERSVPVEVIEEHTGFTVRLEPFRLTEASAAEIFDALYPRLRSDGDIDESQRVLVREFFIKRATEVLDESGARLGLAYLEPHYAALPRGILQGVCTVNGFLADEHMSFLGYLCGKPNRASRDNAVLTASSDQLKGWVRGQIDRRRELAEFGTRSQVMLAMLLHWCYDSMPDDVAYCMIGDRLVGNEELRAWIETRDEIILPLGFPLQLDMTLKLVHVRTWEPVQLRPGWLFPAAWGVVEPFYTAIDRKRDERFRAARADYKQSWQKRWWRMSGYVDGLVLRKIAEVWACEIEDLLQPIEERGWSDFREIDLADGSTDFVAVFLLRRPCRRV